MSAFSFRSSHAAGSARLGWFTTPHGVVETPAFMPVGTHGAVRGLSSAEVADAGARMLLANAYHLYLRPGDAMVRALGGLHAFARWPGPMLTDSGGFQVFSLAKLRTVREAGVEFRSHIDGSLHEYTPEGVMRIERNLGADVHHAARTELISRPGRRRGVRARRWSGACAARALRTESTRNRPRGARAAPPIAIPPGAPPLATHDPHRRCVAPRQALFRSCRAAPTPSWTGVGGRHPGDGAWQGIAIGGHLESASEAAQCTR
jgi:queuine tRNA-ribosyltransferase